VSGSTVVIGCRSGRVLLIRFAPNISLVDECFVVKAQKYKRLPDPAAKVTPDDPERSVWAPRQMVTAAPMEAARLCKSGVE